MQLIIGLPVCPARAGYGGRTDIGAYEYDTRSGGTATLAYDAAGSLTADGDKEYQYDALGRLTYVASGANTNVALASYRYDALGRLAMRITHDYQQDDTDLYDAADTTRYYYYDTPPTSSSIADGGRQILPEVIEVQDAAGDVTDQYVWGPAYVDELLIHDKAIDAQTGDPAERLLAVHDRQYSVLAVTDGDGAVVEQRTFSPYGADPTDPRQGLASVTDADGHRVHPADQASDVMYTGRHYDPAIGQNNHRRRYLSHNFGRWLQADPLGTRLGADHRPPVTVGQSDGLVEPTGQYEDGPSVYQYVQSAAAVHADPSGRCGFWNCGPWRETRAPYRTTTKGVGRWSLPSCPGLETKTHYYEADFYVDYWTFVDVTFIGAKDSATLTFPVHTSWQRPRGRLPAGLLCMKEQICARDCERRCCRFWKPVKDEKTVEASDDSGIRYVYGRTAEGLGGDDCVLFPEQYQLTPPLDCAEHNTPKCPGS